MVFITFVGLATAVVVASASPSTGSGSGSVILVVGVVADCVNLSGGIGGVVLIRLR